jgi:dTDP-glucose 4,6-dehydratase
LADIIWSYTKAGRELIDYRDPEKLTTKLKKVNNDLSIRELGHKETVLLEEGVKMTIDWMRDYYRF